MSCCQREDVVIVTGGSRGIGKGCVKVFASKGFKVAFCALEANADEGKQLEDELNSKRPGSALFVALDLTIESKVKNFIDTVVTKFGRIDCLINNAGWHPPKQTIDEATSEDFLNLLKLNVVSPFVVSKYALPYLRKSGHGGVVNIASISGVLGEGKAVPYSTSKGAIVLMTQSMAVDEAKYNVRVNCVSPSTIDTPLLKQFVDSSGVDKETFTKELVQTHLLQRLGTPEDIGKVCYFLGVEATFTTGHNFMATGGADIGFGNKTF